MLQNLDLSQSRVLNFILQEELQKDDSEISLRNLEPLEYLPNLMVSKYPPTDLLLELSLLFYHKNSTLTKFNYLPMVSAPLPYLNYGKFGGFYFDIKNKSCLHDLYPEFKSDAVSKKKYLETKQTIGTPNSELISKLLLNHLLLPSDYPVKYSADKINFLNQIQQNCLKINQKYVDNLVKLRNYNLEKPEFFNYNLQLCLPKTKISEMDANWVADRFHNRKMKREIYKFKNFSDNMEEMVYDLYESEWLNRVGSSGTNFGGSDSFTRPETRETYEKSNLTNAKRTINAQLERQRKLNSSWWDYYRELISVADFIGQKSDRLY